MKFIRAIANTKKLFIFDMWQTILKNYSELLNASGV